MHPHVSYIAARELANLHAAAEPAPRRVCDALELADGRRLSIRPVEGEDRERMARLFMRLSPESRYRRYLTGKPTLSPRELDHLLDIDHVRHEALAAVDATSDSFVGVARYVQLPDQPDVADIAVEVADDLHRQGIGRALTMRTLERARVNGFTRVTALALRDNTPARALLRLLHFRPRSRGGQEIEYGLELAPAARTRVDGDDTPLGHERLAYAARMSPSRSPGPATARTSFTAIGSSQAEQTSRGSVI